MSIEIKTVGGRVLHTAESASDVRAALVEAVNKGAYLGDADLGGAYLHGAYLRGADLGGAYLRDAYLRGAVLHGADLRDADLRGADLHGAYLRGADLHGAVLQDAKNAEWAIARTNILPDEGDIIGWKKAANGRIVKLRIPHGVKRSNASGRKCRAERAEVLAIYDGDKEVRTATSSWDSSFTYRVGETVTPTQPFDENRWNECASGIHFHITRVEAENHA